MVDLVLHVFWRRNTFCYHYDLPEIDVEETWIVKVQNFFPFAKLGLDLYLENVDSIDLEEKKRNAFQLT